MKKLFLLVIAIAAVMLINSSITKAESTDFKITFRAVLSSPMEMPENYGLLNVAKITDTDIKAFSTMEYTTQKLVTTKDGKLMPEYVATPSCYGNGITFEGWDVNPYRFNYSKLSSDVTFTAYFNNDNAIPVYLSAVSYFGNAPIYCYCNPGAHSPSYRSSTATMFFEPGYTLQKSDKPMYRGSDIPGSGVGRERSWSSPFEGTTVNEPLFFTVTLCKGWDVRFKYMTDVDTWFTTEDQVVYYEEDAIPPESIPEIEGLIFCGWDKPYTQLHNLSCEADYYGYTITAEYAKLGDANDDGIINTSDAVSILRSVVSAQELTNKQFVSSDVNCDSAVNTADAVRILRYTAKLIPNL